MSYSEFYRIDTCSYPDGNWIATNRALTRLIKNYLSKLDKAVKIATKVRCLLESLFQLMDELCYESCPWCPDPCCIVNKVWFDYLDLLFINLINEQIPPAQITSDTNDLCRYLTHRGCILPRIIRPFSCTQFLCPTQSKILNKKRASIGHRFNLTIKMVKNYRFDMDEIVNHVIL